MAHYFTKMAKGVKGAGYLYEIPLWNENIGSDYVITFSYVGETEFSCEFQTPRMKWSNWSLAFWLAAANEKPYGAALIMILKSKRGNSYKYVYFLFYNFFPLDDHPFEFFDEHHF